MQGISLDLPTGYYLERDPDVLILRRLDGSMVGAFSARGAAPEALKQTVEEESAQNEHSFHQGESISQPKPSLKPSLQVRFFGHFEMLCDMEAVPLGRNGKALTILKYLLANRSRPVSQDHLMGWLWPESNLKKARWSLNSAIHGLRKLLSGCTTTTSNTSITAASNTTNSVSMNYVWLEDGYYRLSPSVRVSTDVDEFDELHERGRHLEKDQQMRKAAIEYERAIELYRGDYLIEDLYEDWTMVERERLANAYIDILGRLAIHYMEVEQHQESIRACYRVLEKDRCHEDSYRLLMRCYARLGLRARALHQYRMCEQILSQEYGTSPSPETRSLYTRLL
ncbi:MAG TPA: BTAD domain-containing putative transcriptional regulator, partial [Rubrobacter sp.]|nr:BTAD domain-containing putative transcriptional regulator [Rubrobacter sp.]